MRPESLPRFPGWIAALGPGVVWMALAQGSGELIWWPYIIAKYGLGFLFLLIPACLLQYPIIYQIGHYTAMTGESIWQGFVRLNRMFAVVLWVLMGISFLWFGAFASAGALTRRLGFLRVAAGEAVGLADGLRPARRLFLHHEPPRGFTAASSTSCARFTPNTMCSLSTYGQFREEAEKQRI